MWDCLQIAFMTYDVTTPHTHNNEYIFLLVFFKTASSLAKDHRRTLPLPFMIFCKLVCGTNMENSATNLGFDCATNNNSFLSSFMFVPSVCYSSPFCLYTEHRNMPLEDAMRFVGQNFERYMQDLRERSKKSSLPSFESSKSDTAPAVPVSRSSEVTNLFSKAASGESLTPDQLTKLINDLSKQQKELGGSGSTNGQGGNTSDLLYLLRVVFNCMAPFLLQEQTLRCTHFWMTQWRFTLLTFTFTIYNIKIQNYEVTSFDLYMFHWLERSWLPTLGIISDAIKTQLINLFVEYKIYSPNIKITAVNSILSCTANKSRDMTGVHDRSCFSDLYSKIRAYFL